jgi:DNA recombination protein RmuC
MVAVANLTWGVAGLICGLLIGALVCWLWQRNLTNALKERLQSAEERAQKLEQENAQLQEKRSELERELGKLQEQTKWIETAEARLREVFQALATDALQRNADEFIKRARDQLNEVIAQVQGNLSTHREQIYGLIEPLEKTLENLDAQVRELESKRQEAYGELKQWLGDLAKAHKDLYDTTKELKEAFRKSPTQRGHWGELQLRRIVELAGMERHVDFKEQVGSTEGRPDMIVYLPNRGFVAVDSKVPLEHFLKALEAEKEDDRDKALQEHANVVRSTIQKLGSKEYWEQSKVNGRSPEFVVMFVPHEAALAEAFRAKPNLLEEALQKRVIPAAPIIFFALLKTIAYGWMQHKAIENAEKIVEEAREFHRRLRSCLSHVRDFATSLENTVKHYNTFIGSLERKVMPCVRRLTEMGAVSAGGELPQLEIIEASPRLLDLPEANENPLRKEAQEDEEAN